MMERKFKVDEPSDFNDDQIKEIVALIIAGGAVSVNLVSDRVKCAKKIACRYENDQLIGVGVIKLPRNSYKKRVFECSQSPENFNKYAFELGYISVKEAFRGQKIGSEIVNKLLDQEVVNMYATTNNESMQKILKKHNFQISGSSYNSQRSKNLQLFIKKGL